MYQQVFFNKKKYQIINAKLDDQSIKKRIILIDINEYVPNWATTYWGIIVFPFYKYFSKKSEVNRKVKFSQDNNNSNQKYMYIKVWDPPYFSLSLFSCFSPPQLLYLSKVRQDNWYIFAFQAFIISVMLQIIIGLCVNLVSDKDLINKEVFKEYNEKFVYNKLCVPKFNKCVGTDTDLFEDDQNRLSLYDSDVINKNLRINSKNYYNSNYKPPSGPNRYANNRFNDNYDYPNRNELNPNFRNNYDPRLNNNYQDYYYKDNYRNNIYHRNSYQYNPNEIINDNSYGYSRRDPYSHMNYKSYTRDNDNKYSPTKSIISNKNNNIPKIADVDDNGEFIVTTNINNSRINCDENGCFKSNVDIDDEKDVPYSLKEKNDLYKKSPSKYSFISNNSFSSNTLYNNNNSNSFISLNNNSNSFIRNNNNNNNNNLDKRNLSFSDKTKFVIIDKNNLSFHNNDNCELNEKKSTISHDNTFNNNMKKFQYIDKKDFNIASSETKTKNINNINNKDDDYVCLLDSLE
ncbi:hypothetical protein BCR32DRAFT_295880 [Anaeromyces robustus]|uniref:Uncharacterized protein n=1 Tax=Anaeromyces robustus TaxID=1754192 RepID=A0A1Y1WTY3_9FUNG|nr:hypothetical protein BCR32DRAFT_295880 [Anaeromyces robustus]|eukprot:ORX76997.1 hypothetical protein BCR32DRAFT_295880 [Anaeromyces robustus]